MENLKIIRKDNLIHNIKSFGDKRICAMVKSNAYGLGLEEIVKILRDYVDEFGVATVDEGLAVRNLTDLPILVCSRVEDFQICKNFNLGVMVESLDDLEKAYDADLNVHLKIDCGMNRFGVKNDEEIEKIEQFLKKNNLCLSSIYTHFPNLENEKMTLKNYQKFLYLRGKISQNPPICFGGSGVVNYDFDYDIIRTGISLFGANESFKPVLSINSFVEKVFWAERGEFIGYGNFGRVKKSGFYAIVPVGYGDGLHRNLSGKFYVKIGEKFYKTFGKICMDCFFVAVDDKVAVGDEVDILTDVKSLAKLSNTIPYEILTSFSNFRGKTIVM